MFFLGLWMMMTLFLLAWPTNGAASFVMIARRRYHQHQRQHLNRLLWMGKGFNSAKNKQAALAKKMELARKQKGGKEAAVAEEQEERQGEDSEHEEFAKLLSSNLPPPEPAVEKIFTSQQPAFQQKPSPEQKKRSSGPKVKARDLKKRKRKAKASERDEELEAAEESVVVLREGDAARRGDFDALIDIRTGQPVGAIRAAQLVPWVPPYLTDSLIVLADPRRQSTDMRQAIQHLQHAPHEIIFVTADPVEQQPLWIKQQAAAAETNPTRNIFADDASLTWMRTYACIDESDRWSLHVLLFDDRGTIRKHVSQVDAAQVNQVVTEMVESISR
jgi:hypothetical protein